MNLAQSWLNVDKDIPVLQIRLTIGNLKSGVVGTPPNAREYLLLTVGAPKMVCRWVIGPKRWSVDDSLSTLTKSSTLNCQG